MSKPVEVLIQGWKEAQTSLKRLKNTEVELRISVAEYFEKDIGLVVGNNHFTEYGIMITKRLNTKISCPNTFDDDYLTLSDEGKKCFTTVPKLINSEYAKIDDATVDNLLVTTASIPTIKIMET